MIEEILKNKTESIIDYSNFSGSDLGEAALFGGSMVLIGMLAIFAVLTILWGCLILFKIAFHDIPAKKANKQVVEATPVAEPTEISTVSSDDEIIAVIAAAVAMAESESDGLKFRVVSFKRK